MMGNISEGTPPLLRRGLSHSRTASSGSVTTPDSRSNGNDRTVHYTMKTSTRPAAMSSHSHSHSQSQTSHSQNFRPSKSGTPTASPRMPYSVGQPYPPRLSPSATRITAQDVRTPSPNYFGLIVEPATEPRDSAVMPRENWSPPTSSVKSFAAAIPKQMPLDANPEFEAFKRQADANRGRSGFSLSGSHFAGMPQNIGPLAATTHAAALFARPRAPRSQTHGSDSASEVSIPRLSSLPGKSSGGGNGSNRMEVDADSLHDSAYFSAESKRNSGASLNAPSFLNMGRHESPVSFESPFAVPQDKKSNLLTVDDRHPRLSLTEGKADRPSPDPTKAKRAETVPATLESGTPGMITPAELKDLVEHSPESEFLLLDLRVSPSFAESRIRGAINLCIPTTLLKRATFNLQKLLSTLQDEHDQSRFAGWRDAKRLVVYDAFSSEKRDALSALNMIKKFTNEGYTGAALILRGGFNTFSSAYPHLVDHSLGASAVGLSLNAGPGVENRRPSVAPVIGGVVLPAIANETNPFFSSIRQNVDLVDGVGQMDIALPAGVDIAGLPSWLCEATEARDHGKDVADKFLKIELKEQSRMKEAYSESKNSTNNQNPTSSAIRTTDQQTKVRLSGLEKGGKNRYKDILPFEHARVKLEVTEKGACDYVNASHIKASRSHKRYIASQGPLPATFEDFWSVIWDQDIRVIVMLTAESEGGQLKCHPYWKSKDYGAIKLRSLSEKKVSLDIDKHRSNSIASGPLSCHGSSSQVASQPDPDTDSGFSFPVPSHVDSGRRRANTTTTLECSTPTRMHPGLNTQTSSSSSNSNNGPAGAASDSPYVIIRKFALSHASHPFAHIREITHLHYPSWPDFGAPAQPSHLLALVELANVMQRAALPVDVPSTFAERAMSSNGGITPSITNAAGIARTNSADFRRSNSQPRRDASLPLGWYDEPERDSSARPMLVHCSAGCGRTGTFCTVDSVIDMLKRQRMRAARIAGRRIAERERRFVEQLAAEKEARRRQSSVVDADGDVEMSEDGRDDDGGEQRAEDDKDAISPLASSKELIFPPIFPPPDKHGDGGGRTPTAANPTQGFGSSRHGILGGEEQDVKEEDSGSNIDLSWLGDDSLDLIAATVGDFRTQRLSMVQSLRQFVLCYETIAEWIWRLQERGSSIGGVGVGAGSLGRSRNGSLNMRV